MSDETEVEIENYEKVIATFMIDNSPQPNVRTPTVDGSQQPTPHSLIRMTAPPGPAQD